MDVIASLDLAERIMALQAIPMFSAVDVRDLEPIAELVVECRYDPNEVVFRRGDLEDDMIMIVSGEVIFPGDAPVAPRGPGQYIGELAMLRHSPRALTAVAGSGGMHGMVMNCRLLEGLLEARPQIATAMLRSLAEMLASAEH